MLLTLGQVIKSHPDRAWCAKRHCLGVVLTAGASSDASHLLGCRKSNDLLILLACPTINDDVLGPASGWRTQQTTLSV